MSPSSLLKFGKLLSLVKPLPTIVRNSDVRDRVRKSYGEGRRDSRLEGSDRSNRLEGSPSGSLLELIVD